MERTQRYCVNCASRRADVANPAARYFAAASRKRRQTATAAGAVAPPPGATPNGTRAAGVLFFALLPIAVALGVVVGRGGSGPEEEELLSALREGNAGVAASTATESDSSETVSDSSELLTSDFSLDEGFTVKIDALPVDGTDQAAADEATAAAEDKGAEDVGIINPSDFRTTPDQGQEEYILYSGEFKSKADAEKALSGLKKDFPDAAVIEVTSSSAASGGGGDSADLNQNRVVAETSHGTVHEVTAEPPSEEQVQRDTEIVNDIANQTGQDYIEQQQQLPDVVVVGGDPADAPPLPTGVGD